MTKKNDDEGPSSDPNGSEVELRDSYLAYSRSLRTWLLAFGIGVPALVLTQDSVMTLVLGSKFAKALADLFLCGAAVQVISAVFYKYAMAHVYLAELDGDRKTSTAYRVSFYASHAVWLEFVFDAITIIAYSIGTLLFLKILGI